MRPLLVGLLLASPLSLASCDATSHDRAQVAANAWVADHAGGWNLKIESSDPLDGFTILRSFDPPCPNGLLDVKSSRTEADLTLRFHCPSADIKDLAGLQANFSDYNLGTLFVDVGVPDWKFQAMTDRPPLSSDLTFESWDGVEVALRIETPLFDLFGLSQTPDCGLSGGGDLLPDDCGIQVPYAGPLVLEMRVPLSPDAVRAQVP